MIKLIILDFDDTLIDNGNLDYKSFKQTSQDLNGYIPTKKEIIELRRNNLLAKDIINWLLKKSKNKFNIASFWKNRLVFLESTDSLNHIFVRPYTKYFLKKLKKNHIFIVIATLRKNKKLLNKFIEKEGISDYIDFIYHLTNNKIETRKFSNAVKIKQDMFKIIQKSYSLQPNEILSIGDSLIDYESAKNAKIYHIILKTNKKFNKILQKYIFDFKELNSQLPGLLNKN